MKLSMNLPTVSSWGTTLLVMGLAMGGSPVAAQSLLPPFQIGQISPGLDQQTFFETGRLRSEDTLMFQRPPREVPPVTPNSSGWQFMIFQEGNVSLWIPPGVITHNTLKLPVGEGSVSFQTLVSNDGLYRFIAAYGSDLTPDLVQNPAPLFQAMRDRVAPEDSFTLTGDRPVTLGNYPGNEWQFQSDQEQIVLRTFLINNQIYAIGVVQPLANPREQATRAFLNALQLLNP